LSITLSLLAEQAEEDRLLIIVQQVAAELVDIELQQICLYQQGQCM
jgi:hypothetical protein